MLNLNDDKSENLNACGSVVLMPSNRIEFLAKDIVCCYPTIGFLEIDERIKVLIFVMNCSNSKI